ncbi:MAG: hypothetical protein QNJ92_02445 [Alphaproteobacteria bacterium]|nr:hypothetical protein [Alphaproteobacteria bacterium]
MTRPDLLTRAGAALLAPLRPAAQAPWQPWFAFAMVLASIPALYALSRAFEAPTMVQDDARQFLFWMAEWRQPGLFSGDLIADYFRAVSPPTFKAFYWLLDRLGLDPLLASKILPPLLLLAVAALAFRLAIGIMADPRIACAAAVAAVFFVRANDAVYTATPRAFAAVWFLVFLDGLIRRNSLQTVLGIALLAGFYPQLALVALMVLGLSLLRWSDGPGLSTDRRAYLVVTASTVLACAMVFPFISASGPFGPTITLAEARAVPTFLEGGRTPLFLPGGGIDYLCGHRLGFVPSEWNCDAPDDPLGWLWLLIAVLPPVLLLRLGDRTRAYRTRSAGAWVFVAVLAAAVIGFAASHLVLFELHLPSRYAQTPLRITAPIALAMAATGWWLHWALKPPATDGRLSIWGDLRRSTWPMLIILAALIVAAGEVNTNYVEAKPAAFYRWAAEQSPDADFGGLAPELDSLPILSQRRIRFSQEHTIPYSRGYFQALEQRARAAVVAERTTELATLQAILRDQEIGFYVIHADDLAGADSTRRWTGRILEFGEREQPAEPSALSLAAWRCAAGRFETLVVIDATCVLALPAP